MAKSIPCKRVIKTGVFNCYRPQRSWVKLCFYTCLWFCLSACWDTAPTPGSGHPPPREQCMLGDTGNKRAVRILLQYILVIFWLNFVIHSHPNTYSSPTWSCISSSIEFNSLRSNRVHLSVHVLFWFFRNCSKLAMLAYLSDLVFLCYSLCYSLSWIFLLPPKTKFAKIMFSHVSVCPQGGVWFWSGGVWHPPDQTPFPGQIPPWADTLPPPCRHPYFGQTPSQWADTPWPVHAGIWSTNRLYATHWNAILFDISFLLIEST